MWRRALVAALCAIGAALAVAPAHAIAGAVERAARYLERAQNRDGGLGGMPGARSAPDTTGWAALGLAAAGRDLGDVRRRGGRPLSAAVEALDADDLGAVERLLLARRAAGLAPDPALVDRLLEHRREDGSFTGQTTLTSFATLALVAAGRDADDPLVAGAAAFVAAQQNADGGFTFGVRGGRSGVDDTAAAVQALVAAGHGRRSATVRRAVRFLAAAQRPDGGLPVLPGAPSNAQSTAWAVQALVAAGRRPRSVRRDGSRTPLGYLRSLQAPDGSIRYSRTSAQTPVWVTSQALAALARPPLPIAPR